MFRTLWAKLDVLRHPLAVVLVRPRESQLLVQLAPRGPRGSWGLLLTWSVFEKRCMRRSGSMAIERIEQFERSSGFHADFCHFRSCAVAREGRSVVRGTTNTTPCQKGRLV